MSEKTSEEKEISEQTTIEEEKPQASLATKIKEQKKAKKKKTLVRGSIVGGVLFIGLIINYLLAPYKATETYGICRTLLELQLPYPHTLYVSEIKPLRDGSLRIWYTHTDAFGEYRMENFNCKLGIEEETGKLKIVSLRMHKVFVEPDKIAALNGALIYFQENPLILEWPAPLPDSLQDLHFDFDSVRRIVIDATKR